MPPKNPKKLFLFPSKKQITINLVKSIINDSDLDDVQKSTCLTVIDTTLDDTIDLIVDASNGNLNINQLKKTSVNCLTAILANLCK